MKTGRTDRLFLGIALALGVIAILLMEWLPADLLQVNPVYQGF